MRPISTPRDLGAAIRQARSDRGLTQAALASQAGVSRPWLSDLERGKTTVETGRVMAVLDALGLAISLVPLAEAAGRVDLDDLLSDDLLSDG